MQDGLCCAAGSPLQVSHPVKPGHLVPAPPSTGGGGGRGGGVLELSQRLRLRVGAAVPEPPVSPGGMFIRPVALGRYPPPPPTLNHPLVPQMWMVAPADCVMDGGGTVTGRVRADGHGGDGCYCQWSKWESDAAISATPRRRRACWITREAVLNPIIARSSDSVGPHSSAGLGRRRGIK